MTLINPTRPSEPEPAATRSPVGLTRGRMLNITIHQMVK